MVRKIGTNKSDKIFGTNASDILHGLGGNDTINGAGGNDRMYGGAGNDKMNGGAGNDTMYGGTGNDRMSGGTGNDTMYGDGGNDIINGDAGNDRITGGAGSDRINGGSGTDTAIYAGLSTNYTITHVSGTTWTVADATGTDTLTSVEKLKFADKTIDLTVNHGPDAVSDTAGTIDADAGATVFGSVLANDSDFDGDTLSISMVDGQAGVIGSTITLASGARVTMNADGTFSYDPNGKFSTVPVGTVATDSFTYEISDGNGGTDTATVTIVINGTAPITGSTFNLTAGIDNLVGTANDDTFVANPASTFNALDTLDGGAGNDTLSIVHNAAIDIDPQPALSSVTGIENVNLITTSGKIEADLSAFVGLETVTATTAGAAGLINIKTDGNATSVTTVAGNGVTITDGANETDTLTTVSIASHTGAATITSDALTSLAISDTNQDTTVVAAAGTRNLAVTLDTVTGGNLTDATATGLTINSTVAANTLDNVVAGAATSLTLGAIRS
ncbi:MAG: cadherin-like domain-containing protein [Hyphomicrobiaceae bacterium]